MTSPDPCNEPVLGNERLPPKKRKVRKSTQSCWECKRRKTRCTFAGRSRDICDGCKSRNVACIGQEYPDSSIPGKSSVGSSREKMRQRIESLEASIYHLGEGLKDPTSRSNISGGEKTGDARFQSRYAFSDPHIQENGPPTIQKSVEVNLSGNILKHNQNDIVDGVSDTQPRFMHQIKLTVGKLARQGGQVGWRGNLGASGSPVSSDRTSDRFEEASEKNEHISHALLAIWPKARDLDIILSVPVSIAELFHGVICAPYPDILDQYNSSARDILKPPSVESHPIITSRKLLMLATYLQGVPMSSVWMMKDLSVSYHGLMSQLINTVHDLVLTDDELVDNLEGIECLMIESTYQNNAGNLRRAWLSMRRAMSFAQIMGLHSSKCLPFSKVINSSTRKRIFPNYMWFRLIQSDRYLSLMLGLPQGAFDTSFNDAISLRGYNSLERMERLDTIAASFILQRHDPDSQSLSKITEIEEILQRASSCMPAKWWLIPKIVKDSSLDADCLSETLRVMSQIAHYHILLQLHMPFLLRSANNHEYDSSKIIIANTCRELLLRYISFRSANQSNSYCRGLDFITFIACAALTITHIRAWRDKCQPLFSSLLHQQSSDIGLVESSIEILQSMENSGDMIAASIVHILGRLLMMMADAKDDGRHLVISHTDGGGHTGECNGTISENGNMLNLFIPYYGGIKIRRSDVLGPFWGISRSMPSDSLQVCWRLEKDESHTFRQLFNGEESLTARWEDDARAPDPFDVDELPQACISDDKELGGFAAKDEHPTLPQDISIAANEWSLQEVDLSLFDDTIYPIN